MNATPTPTQSEAERRQEMLGNASFDLARAMHLMKLMQWIERARHLSDSISGHANISASFRDALQDAQIAWNNPDWTDEVSDGLATLHAIQMGLLVDAREVVEPETRGSVGVH